MERLLLLIAQAIAESHENNTWFINYSGHINRIDIDYHSKGWKVCEDPTATIGEYINHPTLSNGAEIGKVCSFIESHLYHIPV